MSIVINGKSFRPKGILKAYYGNNLILNEKEIDVSKIKTIDDLVTAVDKGYSYKISSYINVVGQDIDIKTTLNGHEIIFRVVHAGDLTDYGQKNEGVILQMMKILNTGRLYSDKSTFFYQDSSIRSYIEGDFVKIIGEDLTRILSDGYCKTAYDYIATKSEMRNVSFNNFFLPSSVEIYALPTKIELHKQEGFVWQYWKKICDFYGATSPTNSPNTGRSIPLDSSSTVSKQYWWLRSSARNLIASAASSVVEEGDVVDVTRNTTATNCGVLPACIISRVSMDVPTNIKDFKTYINRHGLSKIKSNLNEGTDMLINTTLDGAPVYFRIVHAGDLSAYGQTKEGVILQMTTNWNRGIIWNPEGSYNYNYSTSNIYNYVEGKSTYSSNGFPSFLPDSFKNYLSSGKCKTYISSDSGTSYIGTYVSFNKFFLPSAKEMYAIGSENFTKVSGGPEGIVWKYWEKACQSQGATEPTDIENSARIFNIQTGSIRTDKYLWLRSPHVDSNPFIYHITINGDIHHADAIYGDIGISPACIVTVD